MENKYVIRRKTDGRFKGPLGWVPAVDAAVRFAPGDPAAPAPHKDLEWLLEVDAVPGTGCSVPPAAWALRRKTDGWFRDHQSTREWVKWLTEACRATIRPILGDADACVVSWDDAVALHAPYVLQRILDGCYEGRSGGLQDWVSNPKDAITYSRLESVNQGCRMIPFSKAAEDYHDVLKAEKKVPLPKANQDDAVLLKSTKTGGFCVGPGDPTTKILSIAYLFKTAVAQGMLASYPGKWTIVHPSDAVLDHGNAAADVPAPTTDALLRKIELAEHELKVAMDAETRAEAQRRELLTEKERLEGSLGARNREVEYLAAEESRLVTELKSSKKETEYLAGDLGKAQRLSALKDAALKAKNEEKAKLEAAFAKRNAEIEVFETAAKSRAARSMGGAIDPVQVQKAHVCVDPKELVILNGYLSPEHQGSGYGVIRGFHVPFGKGIEARIEILNNGTHVWLDARLVDNGGCAQVLPGGRQSVDGVYAFDPWRGVTYRVVIEAAKPKLNRYRVFHDVDIDANDPLEAAERYLELESKDWNPIVLPIDEQGKVCGPPVKVQMLNGELHDDTGFFGGLVREFPGLINGGDDVPGADLVEWLNENWFSATGD